jgi:hypothetical protein
MARTSIGIGVVLVVFVAAMMGIELSTPVDTAAPTATTTTTMTTTTTTTATTTTTTVRPTTTTWTPAPPNPVEPGDCVVNVGSEAEPRMMEVTCDTPGQALFRILTMEPLEHGILPVRPCKETPGTTNYYYERRTSTYNPTGSGFLWCLERIR